MDIMKLRVDWELGYYYDAGKRFGEFWNILIGKPQWKLDLSDDDVPEVAPIRSAYFKSNTLATFYGNVFGEWFNADQTKALEACLVNDPVEIEMLAAMIGVMDQYHEDETAKFTFDKYFEAIQALDKFNWAPCGEDKDLMEFVNKDVKWWITFWTQPDAGKKVEENTRKHGKEIGEAVSMTQKSWADEDFATAGRNYGKMWSLLMGGGPMYA